jgi:hypothetical protein
LEQGIKILYGLGSVALLAVRLLSSFPPFLLDINDRPERPADRIDLGHFADSPSEIVRPYHSGCWIFSPTRTARLDQQQRAAILSIDKHRIHNRD